MHWNSPKFDALLIQMLGTHEMIQEAEQLSTLGKLLARRRQVAIYGGRLDGPHFFRLPFITKHEIRENFLDKRLRLDPNLDSLNRGACRRPWAISNHNNNELPVVLLGGAGGRLKGGRIIDYKGKSERRMCRLYLSMMDNMNVHLPKSDDGTKALNEV